MHKIDYFSQYWIIFTAAFAVVWLFKRLALPAIAAYLIVGILLGGVLKLVSPHDAAVHYMGELGLVFLLFALGLEFSWPKMLALKRQVFGVGPLQILLTSSFFLILLWITAIPLQQAMILALALAFSSTALGVRDLKETGRLHQPIGLLVVSILLFQDLIAIPVLAILPELGGGGQTLPMSKLGTMVIKALIAFIGLIVVGRYLLPRLLHALVSARSDELLMLGIVSIVLMAAGITHWAGLSLSLGAFLGGMMLGESQYRVQIAAELRPFRDLLLGIFFISIGAQVIPEALFEHWAALLALLATLVTLKPLSIFLAARILGTPTGTSMQSALTLWQVGEFGLVIVALALKQNLVSADSASVAITAGVLSMTLSQPVARFMEKSVIALIPQDKLPPPPPTELIEHQAQTLSNHTIICGFGRVGQIIYRFLKQAGQPVIAIDNDATRVQEAISGGESIIYGSSTSRDVLKAVGIERARMLVVSFNHVQDAITIITEARSLNPPMIILCRTSDDTHLDELLRAGATEVIPEALESAMMLVAHALLLSGEPLPKVLRKLQETREDRYGLLHGFYHGEHSDLDSDSTRALQKLHAVTITANSKVAGKRVGYIKEELCDIELLRIQRPGYLPLRPLPDIILQAGDTLILRGSPEKIEAAINRLQVVG